jgi:hypothetical protein
MMTTSGLEWVGAASGRGRTIELITYNGLPMMYLEPERRS